MPLKLSAGISKKMGLPNYGSRGASCHVEVELDGSLLQDDLETFHRHVHREYVACAEAVNKELARHQAAPAGNRRGRNGREGNNSGGSDSGSNGADRPPHDGNGDDHPPQGSNDADHPSHDSNGADHPPHDGNGADHPPHDGNGHADGRPDRQVSPRQIDYVRLLVGQIRGLGVRRLETVCRTMFGRPLSELSPQDVSTLIDTLKEVRAGKRELATVLTGAAP